MKFHRIQLFPKSKLYFNLFLFDSREKMIDYAKTKINGVYEGYEAVVDRSLVKNRIGQLFLHTEVDDITIDHECQHLMLSYMRYRDVKEQVTLNDYIYALDEPYEEELASLFPYIKTQVKIRMMDGNYHISKEEIRNEWELDKDFYKWKD